MTVFKGYMRIIQRNLGYVFLYTAIFLAIILAITGISSRTTESVYQATALNIAVIDNDRSVFSEGIIEALSRNHQVTTDITDKNVLTEEMYYEKIDYVVQIPENAAEMLLDGDGQLEITKNPGDYSGLNADMELNAYINAVRTYNSVGMDMEQAVEQALECMEQQADVTLLDTSVHEDGSVSYYYFFRYLPYLFLYALCFVFPMVLNNFNRKDIERRINSSGVSSFRQGIQGFLALIVLSMAMYVLLMVLVFALYGKRFAQDEHIGLYLLNSFCLMLVATAIAYLIGNLVRSMQAINGVANTVALGMSFLCGVFIDMEVLSKGILAVARFLPVYWYETANITLYEYGSLTTDQMKSVFLSFAIQLAFAAACISVALVIKRRRVNQE